MDPQWRPVAVGGEQPRLSAAQLTNTSHWPLNSNQPSVLSSESRELAGSEDWDLFEGKWIGREKKRLV